MKHIFSTLILLVLIEIISVKGNNNNTCLETSFESECYKEVKNTFPKYTYLKSKAFSPNLEDDITFSVALKKGISYLFKIKEISKDNKKLQLNLYDENDKLIATSTNGSIIFSANESGKYHLIGSFKENFEECCLILFGMIRK